MAIIKPFQYITIAGVYMAIYKSKYFRKIQYQYLKTPIKEL